MRISAELGAYLPRLPEHHAGDMTSSRAPPPHGEVRTTANSGMRRLSVGRRIAETSYVRVLLAVAINIHERIITMRSTMSKPSAAAAGPTWQELDSALVSPAAERDSR